MEKGQYGNKLSEILKHFQVLAELQIIGAEKQILYLCYALDWCTEAAGTSVNLLSVLLRCVRVIKSVRAVSVNITSASFAFANNLRRNLFQVIGQSNCSHRVNKHGRQIVAPAQFGCGIVPGKSVVEVVEPEVDKSISFPLSITQLFQTYPSPMAPKMVTEFSAGEISLSYLFGMRKRNCTWLVLNK